MTALRMSMTCPSCGEAHSPSSMCPPHEVRRGTGPWSRQPVPVPADLAEAQKVASKGYYDAKMPSFLMRLSKAEADRDRLRAALWEARRLAQRGAPYSTIIVALDAALEFGGRP